MLPWYDAYWLYSFQNAMQFIKKNYPEQSAEFRAAIEPFRTRKDFEVCEVPEVLSHEEIDQARQIISNITPNEIEMHEALNFGRFVVHDHEFFLNMQNSFVPMVSELAGEAVEPSYNFLSLYAQTGVCGLHMDAPRAKWTLDICLEQSTPWPIHFGPVQDWPEDFNAFGDQWESQVKAETKFTSITLEPGNAVLFSGSSQWHYRDPIPRHSGENFCHLVFFHYIPKGTAPVCEPEYWPSYFGMPDLPFSYGFSPTF